MTRREPQFLYFDLGNVLLTFDHRTACRQVAELTGMTADRVWEVVFESNLQWRYERGEVTSQEFFEEFCAASRTQPDYAALHHANSAMFELNVPIVPLLAHLWSAGFPLGVLSNTCPAHWDYVSSGRYTAVRDFFTVFVLSDRERCCKPEPEIYRRAIELADVTPDRIFFVDDRPENVAGALAAGIDAVQFEGVRQLADALRHRGLTFNY